MKPTHLPNAPIVEAVIDLRVRELSKIAFDSFRDAERERYPHNRPIKLISSQVAVGPNSEAQSTVSSNLFGIRCENATRTQVIQARSNGFTFSRLKPYEDWEKFRDEARRLWTVYLSCFGPQEIWRVAVRYINRIAPGLPSAALRSELQVGPAFGDELNLAADYFVLRAELSCSDKGTRIVLTEALEPEVEANAALILDIDVFEERKRSPFSEDEVWGRIDSFRKLKNDVFFGCFADSLTVKGWFGL